MSIHLSISIVQYKSETPFILSVIAAGNFDCCLQSEYFKKYDNVDEDPLKASVIVIKREEEIKLCFLKSN